VAVLKDPGTSVAITVRHDPAFHLYVHDPSPITATIVRPGKVLSWVDTEVFGGLMFPFSRADKSLAAATPMTGPAVNLQFAFLRRDGSEGIRLHLGGFGSLASGAKTDTVPAATPDGTPTVDSKSAVLLGGGGYLGVSALIRVRKNNAFSRSRVGFLFGAYARDHRHLSGFFMLQPGSLDIPFLSKRPGQ
jgi:hypothetical protein